MLASRNRGFTLLEVMVALTIAALVFIPMMTKTFAYVHNTSYLRDKTFAQWVALNKITEWRVNKEWLATGEKKGHGLMGGNDWYWKAKITQAADKNIREVVLSVYRTEQERTDDEYPVQRLTAYLIKPR